MELIKTSTEQIRLERDDSLKRNVTPVQQDNQKRFQAIVHLFDNRQQQDYVAHIYDQTKCVYSNELNFTYIADKIQTILNIDSSHHYHLNLSKTQQLQFLLMEFSCNQLSIINFIPPANIKTASSITTLEQLQLAFLALAHMSELIFGSKLASCIRSFHLAIEDISHRKCLSSDQLISFIDSRFQQIKLIPAALNNPFPFASLDELMFIDLTHPSVVQFLDKANTKSIMTMKDQIENLTAKLSLLSKQEKKFGDDTPYTKHKADFSTKPSWSDPSTMKDPCFLWASNKGTCKDKSLCLGLTPRPHSYPANSTDAEKEKFKVWVNSMSSPTFFIK